MKPYWREAMPDYAAAVFEGAEEVSEEQAAFEAAPDYAAIVEEALAAAEGAGEVIPERVRAFALGRADELSEALVRAGARRPTRGRLAESETPYWRTGPSFAPGMLGEAA